MPVTVSSRRRLDGLGAVEGPAEVGDVVAAGGLVAVGGLEEGDGLVDEALEGVGIEGRVGRIEDLGESGGNGGGGRSVGGATTRGANFARDAKFHVWEAISGQLSAVSCSEELSAISRRRIERAQRPRLIRIFAEGVKERMNHFPQIEEKKLNINFN
jgi:hypothetical protein